MDRGLTLRTYLWLAGCLFILAASLSFLAYLLVPLPWWAMVLLLGVLIAAVVEGLEHALARPIERLARAAGRTRDGLPVLPSPPAGLAKAQEITRLWRGMRLYQDHLVQARHARQALEGQVGELKAQVRMLALAGQALEPDLSVEQVAPALLRDLSSLLGVSEIYMVPLRRHCAVPVIGANGQPEWAEAVRASGLAPWEDVLAQGRPVSLCLGAGAPAWRAHWGERALWVVPLNHHGKAQGILLSAPGVERIPTPDELMLISALAPVLASALHPPLWSEERRVPAQPLEAADDWETQGEGDMPDEARKARRRRHKKGAWGSS